MKELIEEKKLSVAYIPAYSPELAPVERYFSMFKRLVTKQSLGLQVNWKSEKSRCLFKQSMHQITPINVQNFWLTLTYEMKESIAKLKILFINSDENLINSNLVQPLVDYLIKVLRDRIHSEWIL